MAYGSLGSKELPCVWESHWEGEGGREGRVPRSRGSAGLMLGSPGQKGRWQQLRLC